MARKQVHRIVLAQLNLTVGDIAENTRRIVEAIHRAKSEFNAGSVVFPELAITGYPPEDLLYRPALMHSVARAIDTILLETGDINAIIGYPRYDNSRIYNSCMVVRNGEIKMSYDKNELPNYGVFDEKRYFSAGSTPCLLELDGITTAISICEDIWTPSVSARARADGAQLMININASPFHDHKPEDRLATLQARIRETAIPVIYLNLVGGQDELVFDGASMVLDHSGNILYRFPEFEEGLYSIDIQPGQAGEIALTSVYQNRPQPVLEQRIYQALVLAVHDYVRKNGFNGVLIGLSGGIDSALVTCVAVDALGADRVEVVLMPSLYTAQMSLDDSVSLAENLGIRHHIVPIDKPVAAFTESLAPLFQGLPTDSTEENIQARCRAIILMALSNKGGSLVLTTGNKSEMAVGYATLYGDMAGGYAPLKDVSKMMVYSLSRWRNTRSHDIPERIIERPPSAELRPDQKDEDSLPPYEILDQILERYIERDQTPAQIIAAGFDQDTVHTIVRLVDKNEYKRRQAAPGVKISKRAFGRERRYPITSGYREE